MRRETTSSDLQVAPGGHDHRPGRAASGNGSSREHQRVFAHTSARHRRRFQRAGCSIGAISCHAVCLEESEQYVDGAVAELGEQVVCPSHEIIRTLPRRSICFRKSALRT